MTKIEYEDIFTKLIVLTNARVCNIILFLFSLLKWLTKNIHAEE